MNSAFVAFCTISIIFLLCSFIRTSSLNFIYSKTEKVVSNVSNQVICPVCRTSRRGNTALRQAPGKEGTGYKRWDVYSRFQCRWSVFCLLRFYQQAAGQISSVLSVRYIFYIWFSLYHLMDSITMCVMQYTEHLFFLYYTTFLLVFQEHLFYCQEYFKGENSANSRVNWCQICMLKTVLHYIILHLNKQVFSLNILDTLRITCYYLLS